MLPSLLEVVTAVVRASTKARRPFDNRTENSAVQCSAVPLLLSGVSKKSGYSQPTTNTNSKLGSASQPVNQSHLNGNYSIDERSFH